MFSILSLSIGVTDKMNAADLLCMQECRQTRDRTNSNMIDSKTLPIELCLVYVKADLRLMNVALNPKFR